MTFQPLFAALDLELGDLLYYLIVFGILLWVVQHYAWGPVTKMMEKRRKKVTDDLDQAASDRKRAELLANQRETALKNSKQEASQILSEAKTSAEKTRKSIIDNADNEAASIKAKAKTDAEQAKKDALAQAQSQVADLSVTIAGKVIAKNLSADDQKDLVDQFIKGLND